MQDALLLLYLPDELGQTGWVNSADPDQKPQIVASDQGLSSPLIRCFYIHISRQHEILFFIFPSK